MRLTPTGRTPTMCDLRGPRSSKAPSRPPERRPGSCSTGVGRRKRRASWLAPREALTVAGQRRSRTGFPRPPLGGPHATSGPRVTVVASERTPTDRAMLASMSGIEPTAARPMLHAATWIVWAARGGRVGAAGAERALREPRAPVRRARGRGARTPDGSRPARSRCSSRSARSFGLLRVVLTVATTHGLGDPMVTIPHVDAARLLGGFTGRRHDRTPGALAGAGRRARHRRRHRGVRRVQRGRLAPRAAAVDAARVPRARPGRHGRAGVRAVDARRAPRVARSRPGPHRRRGSCGAAGSCAMPSRCSRAGMERAVALAESMDARGFGHRPRRPRRTHRGWSDARRRCSALGGAFVALVGGATRGRGRSRAVSVSRCSSAAIASASGADAPRALPAAAA